MPTFIAPSGAFAKALAQVTPVVSSRPLVPAAEHVLLVGTGSVVGTAATVRLLCTSIETTLAVKLNVECTENFAGLIPAKELLETLRGLPDQPVTFTVAEDGTSLGLKTERSKYKLTGLAPADFPKPKALSRNHRAIALPGNELRAGLKAALTTVRRDDLGAEIESVLIQVLDYSIRVVGADNPNIAVFEYAPDANPDTMQAMTATSLMLSRAAAGHLAAILSEKDSSEVKLLADEVNVRLEDGRWASRLGEGKYPQYQRMMPTESPNTLLVDAAELAAAVKRLDRYAPGEDSVITMQLAPDASVSLYTIDRDLGRSGEETVTGDYTGEEMSISFNSGQLINLLALYKGNLEVGFGGPTRAVTLTVPEIEDDSASTLTCLLVPLHVPVAV